MKSFAKIVSIPVENLESVMTNQVSVPANDNLSNKEPDEDTNIMSKQVDSPNGNKKKSKTNNSTVESGTKSSENSAAKAHKVN